MFNIKKFLNLTYYTSEVDQFLADYRHSHPRLTASQQEEKKKYDGIINLRDKPQKESAKKKLMEDF